MLNQKKFSKVLLLTYMWIQMIKHFVGIVIFLNNKEVLNILIWSSFSPERTKKFFT